MNSIDRNSENQKIYWKTFSKSPFFYAVSIIILSINFNCAGCPYSFTGSSVPSHLKTVNISLFDDQSNFGKAGLREQLTKAITEEFINDNSLTITDKTKADATIEGTIERVVDKPTTVVSGETISKRRIEITVKVIYTDMVKRKKIWEKQFTNWGDYSSSGAAFTQRDEGITTAVDKISEDILLQVVSGW
jgi:hypothetical protein